jgi:nitroimidazol reductase NimA-like FMN-containing flavoprotein (pyridoxamine 5'-phosphate oxidase superfamily)
MRGEIRRKELELPKQEALEIIRTAEYGVLATVDAQGRPCTVALNHLLVGEDTIYFHCGLEGEKLENIKAHPDVSFFITGSAEVVYSQFITAYTSVVVNGTLAVITDEDERHAALAALVARFSDETVPQEPTQQFIETGLQFVQLLKLTAHSITGKARLKRSRPCLSPIIP